MKLYKIVKVKKEEQLLQQKIKVLVTGTCELSYASYRVDKRMKLFRTIPIGWDHKLEKYYNECNPDPLYFNYISEAINYIYNQIKKKEPDIKITSTKFAKFISDNIDIDYIDEWINNENNVGIKSEQFLYLKNAYKSLIKEKKLKRILDENSTNK